MKAWDVLVITPKKQGLSDSKLSVDLPSGIVEATLIKSDVCYDFYYLDTVFFDEDCSREYVRTSLIYHDGYPVSIRVDEAK